MIQYLRIATRGSPLARWQADYVAALHGSPVQSYQLGSDRNDYVL